MITIYGIRNCDTMKKSFEWLQQHGLEYRFHDYRKEGCTQALVRDLLTRFTLDELVNRRGTTWRRLPESSREELSDETAPELLAEHPALIRRPLVIADDYSFAGFSPGAFEKLSQ